MKKITLVMLTIAAFLVQSCDEWPPDHGGGNGGGNKTELVGNWRWISSEGGIFPMLYTPENQGFEANLILRNDKSYSYEQTTGLTDFGSYISGKFEDRQTIELQTASTRPNEVVSVARPGDVNFVDFQGKDTLILSGVGADMLTYTYVRVR
jgi:hypothetical protein